ncbi:MAG: heat-inducible transcriptional repressor HrcA [Acidobacteriia bacterium]|nr:heat-inducible transcriptional repressor HrcA [Terriglobia bacterium]
MTIRIMDRRSQDLFMALMRAYIAQGEPIGSETLRRRTQMGLSPATIRNVLSELEDWGYLTHPHTSAGRIPTDKGYRLYVDSTTPGARMRPDDERLLRASFAQEFEQAAHPLEHVSHLLAEISNSVGMVVATNVNQGELQHLEFVRLGPKRILVVLVTKPGIVQNRLLVVQESFTQSELNQIAHYLMASFPGRSLMTIRKELQDRLRDDKARCDELLKNAFLLCHQHELDSASEEGEVFIDGASKIANASTFPEVEKLKELLEAFEEKSKLLRLVNQCLSGQNLGIRVMIGSENPEQELTQCSVVTAPYWSDGKVAGALGIIGPKRMPYDRAIALVEYTAKMVSQMLNMN